jgi:hypothetical protein
MNTDLDDDLAGLFGGTETRSFRVPESFKPVLERAFTEACSKCGGTGRYRSFGQCYACKGSGKKTFKTAPDQRAKGREYGAARAERKAESIAEDAAAFTAANPDLMKWLIRAEASNLKRGGTFDFPSKMIQAVAQYGSLTENQLAAVQRLMARDAVRADQRKTEQAANAVTVDVTKIEQAFATARERATRKGQMGLWTKPLKLRANEVDFVIQPGSQGSQWENMLFVKSGDRKLGYVKDGTFNPKFSCTPVEKDAIVRACSDPFTAVKAYSKAWSRCGICGQMLTNDGSIERGIGLVCAAKYGWA